MLTCDAFGVLPPLSRLTPTQAVFHFLSGYTAKVAGTEDGITEPEATFSACFGAPFMALPPTLYAELLLKKIKKHHVSCWLLNTGWAGEPYGKGNRIKIAYSRALIDSALDGSVNKGEFEEDPIFRIMIPKACKGVPPEILNPRNSTSNREKYEERAKKLALGFKENLSMMSLKRYWMLCHIFRVLNSITFDVSIKNSFSPS